MRTHALKQALVLCLVFLISQPTSFLVAGNSTQSNMDAITRYSIPKEQEPTLTHAQIVKLIQQKIKYVFVLYQENRSFDSYFGTFPGAQGLFSSSAANTPGFTQEIINTDGTTGTISPFRIGPKETSCGTVPKCYAADTEDIDHSHVRIVAKMDIQNGVAKMDKFAMTEELKYYTPPALPSLQAKQMGELAMAYEDCDTIPLLWGYAQKFVLFDHIFQQMTGPSTPGNLAIIGAQSGLTQWVLHPDQASTGNLGSGPGVPLLNDSNPFWGSAKDTTPASEKMPYNPSDDGTPEINLTFATLPLTLQGKNLESVTASDRDAATDLEDVKDDVGFISNLKLDTVPFGWYEEGFDKEPTDPGPTDASGTHAAYITHHNGPQYFGYISNNPEMNKQLHGLGDFFTALQNKTLPTEGGVFYVKGGYQNQFKLLPVNTNKTVQANFPGDDDHPGYSDSQISEAMVAEAINQIAASPYWPECAIILTWDDSEGDYDHVAPPIRTFGPDGSVISDGPRVPLLVISPYARVNYVAHDQGDHASVVKFIDAVFNLPPLALLPDELLGRFLGEETLGQTDLGPEDALTPGITDLTGAFDPARLNGNADPLPADYVEIASNLITNLPLATGYGCADIGIITTDRELGIKNVVPSDFNPLPKTLPTPVKTTTE